jgi:hypothetical protein
VEKHENKSKCETESGFIFTGRESPLKWRDYGDEFDISRFCFCCKFTLEMTLVINVLS